MEERARAGRRGRVWLGRRGGVQLLSTHNGQTHVLVEKRYERMIRKKSERKLGTRHDPRWEVSLGLGSSRHAHRHCNMQQGVLAELALLGPQLERKKERKQRGMLR